MAEHQPKITTVERIILVLIIGSVDVLQFFIDFIDGGIISSWIINPPVLFMTQLYFRMKGVKGSADLAGNLAEFIPVVNALPLRTATLIVTFVLDSNPRLAKTASGGKPTPTK